MKSIESIRNSLRNIDAMVDPHSDPASPPSIHYPIENITTELGNLPVFESDTQISIPDWVGVEILDPLRARIEGQKDARGLRLGVDALAWYVSFHREATDWGIYVPVSSLVYLHERVFSRHKIGLGRASLIGLRALLAHEYVHFAVDYACAQWEIMLRTPCWNPAVSERASGNCSYFQSEEQLANATMLKQCYGFLKATERSALEVFVSNQPPGYCDAKDAIEQGAYERAFAEVLKHYVGVQALCRNVDLCTPMYDHIVHLPSPAEYHGICPIYVIHDEGLIGLKGTTLRFVRIVNVVDETPEFKKRLATVEEPIRKRWQQFKKRAMEQGLTLGDGFEYVDGEYSVRLNRNFRAHLVPTTGGIAGPWRATRLGSHKEMGHG